jgi:type IV fimbrial biogenesis protein FimT
MQLPVQQYPYAHSGKIKYCKVSSSDCRCPGFSLHELLMCLIFVGLMTMIALPGMGETLQRHQGEKVIDQLVRAVNLARYTALEHGAVVTLCRSLDGYQCSGRWEQGCIVFIDHNANRQLDPEDRLIYHFDKIKQGTLVFRSFQNRQYIQFTAMGFTNNQNGNFTWCPADGNAHLAQQLIINRAGRTRLAIDISGDGLRQDSQGRPLTC